MARPPSFWSLGRVIPVMLVLAFSADIAARFLPVELFAFRAWEAVFRYPVSFGGFTPDRHYVNDRASGDLAINANRPELRQTRLEIFTTDRFGFRQNPGEDAASSYDAILIGDSFAAGSGLRDEDTLTAQLERLTHQRIFNAGGMKIDLTRTLRLLEHLKPQMRGGVVLCEYLERYDLLPAADVREAHLETPAPWNRFHKMVEKYWHGFWEVSPIEILARRCYKRLQNDRLLPNVYASGVVIDHLRDGRPILFLPEQVTNLTKQRTFDLSGFLKLRDELRARGFELRVILVPEKYTIYAPLLQNPLSLPAAFYLDQVEKVFHAAGIPVLNLLPVFQTEASRRLSRGETLYFLDDTHWNADGVRLAAETIQKNKLL